LNDLFIDRISSLDDAERQLIDEWPEIARAVDSLRLRCALSDQVAMAAAHLSRLDQLFQGIDVACRRRQCIAIQGLIIDARDAIRTLGAPAVKDLAVAGVARGIVQLKIAGYSDALAFAERVGYDGAAASIRHTLSEEHALEADLQKIVANELLSEAQEA